MTETFTVTIVMHLDPDSDERFDPETFVKNAWSRMIPWFTERHGVREGSINLNHGHPVTIDWKYETLGEIEDDAA
jgi:hypothetical protein